MSFLDAAGPTDTLAMPPMVPGLAPEEPEAAVPEPIELLTPGSDAHAKVLKYLLDRLKYSEREMSNFYDRWAANEKKFQAYIDLPDYEKMLAEMNKSGKSPNVTSITVPYAFATIWTIVTYLLHTFCGRNPMFQVGSRGAEGEASSQKMEVVLQYNADHTRLIKKMVQHFLDGEIYGLGVFHTKWKVDIKKRTVWRSQSPAGPVMPNMPSQQMKFREEKVVYEGNEVSNIDPFMFFPDPRIPMSEVNKRGEFCFWRAFEGQHTLKQAEARGELMWVDKAPAMSSKNIESAGSSSRSLVTKGEPTPGDIRRTGTEALPFYQVDQGACWIVPADLGLGEETEPALWLFTVLNSGQVVQAEPLELDHDMIPVAVSEPYTFGYAFGQLGMMDMLGPIQDTISWFVNSHIHNVRSVLNNQIIVDPSMVEMQDLKEPEPGKIIRLKRSAIGQDVRTALQQLTVADVTSGHVADMKEFVRIGDSLSSVNDNLRGTSQTGGRKTATEMRIAGESGSSRLAAHARLISAQSIVDLTAQMALNIQQNMTQEFWVQVLGEDGIKTPLHIQPQMLVGDFYFPVADGTLPIDKGALVEIWKEILFGIAADPILRQQFDLTQVFEWVAELGGAKNMSRFRLQQGSPTDQLQRMMAANAQVPGGQGPPAQPAA